MAVFIDQSFTLGLDVALNGTTNGAGQQWAATSGSSPYGDGNNGLYAPAGDGVSFLDAVPPGVTQWGEIEFWVYSDAGQIGFILHNPGATSNRDGFEFAYTASTSYIIGYEGGFDLVDSEAASVNVGALNTLRGGVVWNSGTSTHDLTLKLNGTTLNTATFATLTDAGKLALHLVTSNTVSTGMHIRRVRVAELEADLDAAPPVLDDMGTDNAAIVKSPCNWEQDATALRTNQLSAYCGWKFSGTYCEIDVTDCVASLDTEPGLIAGDWPKIAWQINGGPFQYHQLATGDTVIELADDGDLTGNTEIFLVVCALNNGYDLYTTGGYYFGINEIRVLDGETLTAPTQYSENWLLYGDSTVAGWNSESIASVALMATTDATTAFPLLLRKMKQAEIGVKAVGGQGWCVGPNNDDFPPLYTPANDTESTWNKTRAGVSILSAGNFPVHVHRIITIQGRNDHASAVSDANVQASLEGFYTDSRTAAAWQIAAGEPPVKHDIVVPFGGGKRSILTSTAATLRTTNPDVTLHDLFTDLESNFDATGAATATEYSYDQIHPGDHQIHGIIAGRLAVALTTGPNRTVSH
jgi:hypothetical protein